MFMFIYTCSYDANYTATYSDDTFTITNTYKPLDLALRKYISATIAEDGTVNEAYNIKIPKITQNSLNALNIDGTAEYYHNKSLYRDDGFIQVGYGEKVLYKTGSLR